MSADHRMWVFVSDDDFLPRGEYLVTLWDSGTVEIAWRPERRAVWGPPVQGEER